MLQRVGVVLAVLGCLVIFATAVHGYNAYTSVASMNDAARLTTPNPLVLFDDVTTNGVRVDNAIDARSRSAYTEALNQFVLDGTALCLALVVVSGGLFLRLAH